MTKLNLIRKISEKVNEGRDVTLRYSHKDIENMLNSYMEVVLETLTDDKSEKVSLLNLGHFEVKHTNERKKASYFTGERKEYIVPAKDLLVFKPSSAFKVLA